MTERNPSSRKRRWWRVRLLFEPRDLWIGAFIGRTEQVATGRLHALYVCLVPTLPLLIEWVTDRNETIHRHYPGLTGASTHLACGEPLDLSE